MSSIKKYRFLIFILILPTWSMFGTISGVGRLMPIQSMPVNSAGTKMTVNLAQDDPLIYPGPGEDEDISDDTSLNDSVEDQDNLGYPAEKEIAPYPAKSQSPIATVESKIADPVGGLAAMIYLWMAFIAAIVILTAAVLGSILLYTRQRTRE